MKAGTYHLLGGPADGEHVEIDERHAAQSEKGAGVVYVNDDEEIIGRYEPSEIDGVLRWKAADD